MIIVTPDYYSEFACKAGNCLHTCCKGWEIDIDEETYSLYKTIEGDFGKRLAGAVDHKQRCFKNKESGRCPFLNNENLCDIIIELGEGALCQICADHPRFVNLVGNREEIGLGLTCEAAAELILSRNQCMKLVEEGEKVRLSEEENAFLSLRTELFECIWENSFENGIRELEKRLGLSFPKLSGEKIAEILTKAERLEESWSQRLLKLKKSRLAVTDITENMPAKQLFTYFIYRHLAVAVTDGRYVERIKFAYFSTCAVCLVSLAADIPITEAARAYSSEIEYSEENTEMLMEI